MPSLGVLLAHGQGIECAGLASCMHHHTPVSGRKIWIVFKTHRVLVEQRKHAEQLQVGAEGPDVGDLYQEKGPFV